MSTERNFLFCHELSKEGFEELHKAIVALGYGEATASKFTLFIGDTPLIDGAGNVFILDQQGQEITKLPLAHFFE